MENSRKVLFDDDLAQWYIAMGTEKIGPLTASEVYEKVLGREISWAHFVWKPGLKEWRRICDIDTFQAAVPQLPPVGLQPDAVKAPAKPSVSEKRIWFLYYNDSQFGPFSFEEISRFLNVGKIHGKVHGWKEGLENWTRLEKIEEFEALLARPRTAPAAVPPPALSESEGTSNAPKEAETQPFARREMRETPRRPLLAKTIVANDEAVTIAMCRDISVGGMQVLTDQIPGPIGTVVKLNVSATAESGQPAIPPFVAEGVIVRIMEDGRGFSFRFQKLPESARKAIEAYIQQT